MGKFVFCCFIFLFVTFVGVADDCKNTFKKCPNPEKGFRISAYSRSIKLRKAKKVRIVINAYGGYEYFFSSYSKTSKVGPINFRIIEAGSNKILYDNSTTGMVDNVVFKVENAQKLYVEIFAPSWNSKNDFECAGFKVANRKL